MKHIIASLALLAILIPLTMSAHDFEVDGIYYNIKGTNVAVTYKGSSFFSTYDYSGTVTIPSSVTYEGTTYSVTSIEYSAFAYSYDLTKVNIPNSVTKIDDQAFRACQGLKSITIPSSVTFIGTLTFYDCYTLTSMVVESGNTVYDSRDNCNAIIQTVTNKLIYGCQNTIIPNTVTTIGADSFCSCRTLTSIDIPRSVTTIGDRAFAS